MRRDYGPSHPAIARTAKEQRNLTVDGHPDDIGTRNDKIIIQLLQFFREQVFSTFWAGLKTRPYELAGSNTAVGIIDGLCLEYAILTIY